MLHANRIFFGAAALFVFLIVFAWLRRDEVSAALPPQRSMEAELGALRADLEAFRAGDDSRLVRLRESAHVLCERWLRCDAREVVEYYAALTPPERARGIEQEREFQRLREATQEAAQDAERWQAQRPELLGQLEQLALNWRDEADRVPRARVQALIARLIAEQTPARDDPQALTEWAMDLESQLEAAQAGFVRAGMLRPRIELDWIRARLQHETGQFARAERGFEECLDLARRMGDTEWQQRALDELYRIAEEAGDLSRMRALLDQLALLSPADVDAQPWSLRARHALQLIWQDQARAAEEFLRAHPTRLPLGREAEQHALLLGQALLRQGLTEEARQQWARVPGGSPFAAEARLSEAQADLASGAITNALSTIAAHAPGSDASAEREAAWRTLRAEAFLKAGKPQLAQRDLERALARIRAEERTVESERDPLRVSNLFGEVLGLHAVALLAEAWIAQGDALQAACVIESAQSRSLRGAPELARGDLLAWAASAERGLVTWIVAADQTWCVAVSARGEARAARIPHGRRAIEEGVRRLREACWSGEDARVERLSGELSQALFPQAIAPFALQGKGRILLLLHGPLESMPIECLEGGIWFPDGLLPKVLPGLPGAAPAPAWDSTRQHAWQLCGDPRDERGNPLLEHASRELQQLHQLLPGSRLLRGAQFDERNLRAALTSGEPVHIATHMTQATADHNQRYADLALQLDEGARIATRTLAEWPVRAPLVVLAACESGTGTRLDGEGLQGPARALLEQGVPRVVVTLWPVEDRWAQAFGLAFHRGLLQGLRPSEACAQARRALRAQGATVAQWAAFRSLGSD